MTDQSKKDSTTYPKIGLALGGGAAKAVCEYGMLKKIVEAGIPIHSIMGASCGAIMGALYATNLNFKETEDRFFGYFQKGKFNSLFNINIWHGSFYKGDYIAKIIKEIFGEKTFADCKIPFSCLAVDLESGKNVVFKEGKLWEALVASSAIPGFIEPFFKDGHLYTDGSLIEDVPFSTLRKTQPELDLIIGMRVRDTSNQEAISATIFDRFYKKKSPKFARKNFLGGILKTMSFERKLFLRVIERTVNILRDELFEYKLQEGKPDLLLDIEIDEFAGFDFSDAEKIAIRGEQMMIEYLPSLKALIEKKKKQLNLKGENVTVKKQKSPKTK